MIAAAFWPCVAAVALWLSRCPLRSDRHDTRDRT